MSIAPVDFMAKLPTQELKDKFFKELLEPMSDPLGSIPDAETQRIHRDNLMEKYSEYIGD